jgi:hypothetical protein
MIIDFLHFCSEVFLKEDLLPSSVVAVQLDFLCKDRLAATCCQKLIYFVLCIETNDDNGTIFVFMSRILAMSAVDHSTLKNWPMATTICPKLSSLPTGAPEILLLF